MTGWQEAVLHKVIVDRRLSQFIIPRLRGNAPVQPPSASCSFISQWPTRHKADCGVVGFRAASERRIVEGMQCRWSLLIAAKSIVPGNQMVFPQNVNRRIVFQPTLSLPDLAPDGTIYPKSGMKTTQEPSASRNGESKSALALLDE